ncbi:MAG TPA: serine hydrolase domain-containing protein [Syntrophorhabdaceae bacterium]|nr:serine hydrolase domain-containing protein [Syntrophorhabdaceae bacterium]
MKRVMLIVVIVLIVIATGMLILRRQFSTPSFTDLNQEMQYLLSDLVKNDKTVKNCVLSVVTGDGSFSFSGAAGTASQGGQVPMTRGTPIHLASITKLYTATVIMRLYEKGLLSLDDTMSRYLPEELIKGIHVYKGKDYSQEITIRQLLSHTSGIADYYMQKPKGGKSVFELLLENPERTWTTDETIEWARDKLEPNFRPGTNASYSDTNFALLGKIIDAITGEPRHTVYEDLIFRPLGLTHTWLVDSSAPHLPEPFAPADVFYKNRNIANMRSNGAYWPYVVSTAEEMIVFLKALNDGRLVRKETLKLMHDWHRLQFPLQYGFGTMYFKLPPLMTRLTQLSPLWGHSGSAGSFLYYSQDLDLYLAGTIDQVDSKIKPFVLMMKVVRAFRSRR